MLQRPTRPTLFPYTTLFRSSSADHRSVDGQLERAKKQISIRGLNQNCNHDLKNLFKGAAIVASSKPGPFQEDRKSTRLNSSHRCISYAVFCLKKKKNKQQYN